MIGLEYSLVYKRVDVTKEPFGEWIAFHPYNRGSDVITLAAPFRDEKTGDEILFFRVEDENDISRVILLRGETPFEGVAVNTATVTEVVDHAASSPSPTLASMIIPITATACIVSLNGGLNYSLLSFPGSDGVVPEPVKEDLEFINRDSLVSNAVGGSFVVASPVILDGGAETCLSVEVFSCLDAATTTTSVDVRRSFNRVDKLDARSQVDVTRCVRHLQAMHIPLFGGFTVAMFLEHEVFFWAINGKFSECIAGMDVRGSVAAALSPDGSCISVIDGAGVIYPMDMSSFSEGVKNEEDPGKFVDVSMRASCPGGGVGMHFNSVASAVFYHVGDYFIVHQGGDRAVVLRDDFKCGQNPVARSHVV